VVVKAVAVVVASFVLLVWGYTAAAPAYSPVLFTVVGLFAGPLVGAATAWIRVCDLPAEVGMALLSGIAVGDAAYGLTRISDSTHPAYWILIGLIGMALIAVTITRAHASARVGVVLVSLVGTVFVAGEYWTALRVISGGVLLC
jgi:hypothetical protein